MIKSVQLKPHQMILGDNLSRAGVEHTQRSIRKLAEEIVSNGWWNPPNAQYHKNTYTLVAGFKRWFAATLLFEEGRLPKEVGDKKGIWITTFEDREQIKKDAINAAENIDRENLNTYQTARTLYELHLRHGISYNELSIRFSRFSDKTIKSYIRLCRQLIKPIQDEWRSRDGTDNPIGLTVLLRWAALDPEKQEEVFKAFMRPGKLKMRKIDNRRSVQAIETRLSHETNQTVRKTLLWVLNEDEDGRDDDRDDSRSSGGNTASLSIDTDDSGSRRASNGGNRSVREDGERRLNGTPEDDSATLGSESSSPKRSDSSNYATILEEATSSIRRATEFTRRKRP